MDVIWSLNSDVIAAIRTPPRPNRGLISTGFGTSLRETHCQNWIAAVLEIGSSSCTRVSWKITTMHGTAIKFGV
jgi:hypothetical protein